MNRVIDGDGGYRKGSARLNACAPFVNRETHAKNNGVDIYRPFSSVSIPPNILKIRRTGKNASNNDVSATSKLIGTNENSNACNAHS